MNHFGIKRFIAVLIIGLGAYSQSLAQGFYKNPHDILGVGMPRNGVKWPVRKGSLWVSAGTSKWLHAFPRFGKIEGIPWRLAADYSLDDHLTVGFYGGYYQASYDEPYGSERYYSYLKSYVGGVSMAFHFSDLFNNLFHEVINTRRWDLYTQLTVGLVHYEWTVDAKYLEHRDFTPLTYPSVGFVAGARYFATKRIGLYVEGGKGIYGYLGFGVAAKVIK